MGSAVRTPVETVAGLIRERKTATVKSGVRRNMSTIIRGKTPTMRVGRISREGGSQTIRRGARRIYSEKMQTQKI